MQPGFRRRLVLATAVVAAVLALAAEARATSPTYRSEDPESVFSESRWLFRFGLAVGTADVGDLHGTAIGGHVALARAWGKVELRGEYDLLNVSEGDPYLDHPRAGLMHRAGAGLRWQPIGLVLNRRLNTGFWIEGTAGRELFVWDKGGTLTRNDLSIGVGVDFIGNFAEWGQRPKLFGFGWAFRFIFADNPYADVSTVSVCGGPCDNPTPPPSYDMSFLFVLELQYGRR